jgi:uncharacterized protein YbjT (DUF2867 family)
MHFLLLGATGRTGQHVSAELLRRGHTVVALVRSPSNVEARPGLTIITGTPLSKTDIERALAAVPGLKAFGAIMTLNTTRRSERSLALQSSPRRFLADSCANTCEVLEEAGIRRVVVMSMAGAGESWNNLPMLTRAFIKLSKLRYALKDHDVVDQEIRQTRMNWTLVRPVRLQSADPDQKQDDAPLDVQTLGSSGDGMRLTDSASVEAVARFLVEAAVKGLFVRSAVVVRDYD